MKPKKRRISKIYKRDGRLVLFEPRKIAVAIDKAFQATRTGNREKANVLTHFVISLIEKKFTRRPPSVEEVQDIVERVLIHNKFAEAAKAYIIYRQKHTQIRESKKLFVSKDELKLSLNAINVLKKRYLKKDNEGKIIESPMQMFRRVAHHVAKAERSKQASKETEEKFYKMLSNLEFIPNSPTLMNADTEIGQLSGCFVLPIGDSMKGIFTSLKNMALIHQSGGGTGFSFSNLRPEGDIVCSTKGIASGPVSFMTIYDKATEVVKQGGRRRGANMGILSVDHPDIIQFITAKKDPHVLMNFNISVAVTDSFMHAVERDSYIDLINPRTKKPVIKTKAREIFDLIVTMAWQTGDPGVIFIDEINKHNPTPSIGEITSTNPCGEQPLLSYESCNLGSINLAKFVSKGKIQWKKLAKTVHNSVHFLDNVIEVNKFPLKKIEETTKANRKIGLGIMGFADMLIQLSVRYDSEEALNIAEKIMKFIQNESRKASVNIAQKKGSFKNFRSSTWNRDFKKLRNAQLTTIAPTGTISIIAGCSSGIEPLFGISFVRRIMDGVQFLENNADFEKIAKERGFFSKELMIKIAKTGSIQDIKEIPADIRRVFVTSHDIDPEWHIRLQAAFQKYTDSAVSKTINLPPNAPRSDVAKAYRLAWKLKCKGITVYRYGSKPSQVLSRGRPKDLLLSADAEFSGDYVASECCF